MRLNLVDKALAMALGACVLASCAAYSQTCSGYDVIKRKFDAELLTTQARQVRENLQLLCKRAQELKGGVETDVLNKRQLASYGQLLKDYRQALDSYERHRVQYQQHCQAYHHNPALPDSFKQSLAIPAFQPLKISASEACNQLKETEESLVAQENQLNNLLTALASNSSAVRQQSASAQELSSQLQATAMQYDNLVIAKQATTTKDLQAIFAQANRDGDYVESQNAFAESKRRTALENEALKRAHSYSQIAQMLSMKVSLLGNVASQQLTQTPEVQLSAEELEQESAALDAEYQQLQNKFALLQQADPKGK